MDAEGGKKSTPPVFKFGTSNFFSYKFIFIIVFIVVYMILTMYTASPVYCMSTEEVPNITAENSSTFMGINNTVAAAWIAATGAVVATVTAPPAVKMKLLGGGSLGGLAALSLANKVSEPQNWAAFKKTVQTGFTGDTINPLNHNNVKELSVIPFHFYDMMNYLFAYFPSLKTILLERLPDESSENFIMTYQTLFTQYNLMVLISLFSLAIIICLYTMIFFLNFIKTYKFYLLQNYPNFLGKLANSRYIDVYIIVLTLCLYLNFIVLGQCLYFMFVNYIPSNIGNITDIALQNKK
ncbi:hypothetical protein HYO34_21805 [Vibrio parahaemolyticus]|nr:hypothetical protein [Vibrio parahaemolyticus]MBM4932729.1 hypothetical protein [Vibrio parahaemolyticus]